MTNEPVVISIEFHIKPGHENTVRDGLTRALQASTDPALLTGQVLVDTADESHVYAIQTWASADLFHAHMHAAGGFDSLSSVLKTEPHVVLTTVHSRR
ncbi:putative quinol monooxygenase [Microbacterium sp. GXF6406]